MMQHDQERIAEVFVNYFKSMLGESGGHRRKASTKIFGQGLTLTVAQQCEILKPFNEKDIKSSNVQYK